MRRALSFLTPFGGTAEPAPSALAWFPAIGALGELLFGGGEHSGEPYEHHVFNDARPSRLWAAAHVIDLKLHDRPGDLSFDLSFGLHWR